MQICARSFDCCLRLLGDNGGKKEKEAVSQFIDIGLVTQHSSSMIRVNLQVKLNAAEGIQSCKHTTRESNQ